LGLKLFKLGYIAKYLNEGQPANAKPCTDGKDIRDIYQVLVFEARLANANRRLFV